MARVNIIFAVVCAISLAAAIEPVFDENKDSTQKPAAKQEAVTRSTLLDNVFNIPIQTLRAVNDLVQSISGSLQQAGASTYFQRNTNRRPYADTKDEKHSKYDKTDKSDE